MRNVTYINAGAGSGKTYTLTEILSDTLALKHVSPSEIILTTFTVPAAKEFKTKSKAKLFEKGLFEEANLLDTAMIGTIHSVAYSIISKFWYQLGLSPKLDILTEEDSDAYRSESLGSLATAAELDKLARFAEKFDIRSDRSSQIDPMFWKSHISSIIGFATNYQITDFTESCEKSKAFFRQFVSPNVPAIPSTQEFANAVQAFEEVNNSAKESKTKEERKQTIRELKRNLGRRILADYAKFLREASKTKTFANDSRISPVLDALVSMWQSKEIYEQVAEYINIIFDLASRWQKQYAEFKKVRNLLDFNDLEKYLLQLLEDEEAACEIGASYRYLFVDEFQDCSPIQVKIFHKLSTLVEHSYWVGDMKQSIYGFRGSDPKLVESVIKDVDASQTNGCNIQTLPFSWRSVPEIVNLCNDVFVTAFSDIPAARVKLTAQKTSDKDIQPLTIWKLNGSSQVARNEEIACLISEMVKHGVQPNDIAVLARSNNSFDNLALQLAENGIPVNRSAESPMASLTATLACAVLRLADNNADTLAKAEIAFLTDDAYYTGNIISKTLKHIDVTTSRPCHDFLNDVHLINKILGLRASLKHQSLSEFVESVLLELDMYEIAKVCEPEEYVERVLNTIIAAASQYQESAARLGTVASVAGFINFLDTREIGIPGDSSGVNLLTIHKAKGLEWKHVIVTPLSENPADEEKILKRECFGTHFCRNGESSAENAFGNVFIQLTPYIFGVNTKTPNAIAAIIKNSEEFKKIKAEHISEEARVLYVAMTRPSHQLILPLGGKKPYQWLEDIGVDAPSVFEKHSFENHVAEPVSQDDIDEEVMPEDSAEDDWDYTFRYAQPAKYEHRDRQPSLIQATSCVISHHNFGKRIPLNRAKNIDMSRVGNCIHHIYQLCDNQYPSDLSVANVIAGYGLSGVLANHTEIRDAWHQLHDYVHKHHGAVRSHRHERSFIHNKDGQSYTGSIDLTFETDEGTVLVDYKTCPLGDAAILDENNEHFAGHYSGQLSCYRNALTAAGEKVCATYVYYPVSGILVQLL